MWRMRAYTGICPFKRVLQGSKSRPMTAVPTAVPTTLPAAQAAPWSPSEAQCLEVMRQLHVTGYVGWQVVQGRTVLHADEAGRGMLGFHPEEELGPRQFFDCVDPHDRPRLMARWQRLCAHAERVVTEEFSIWLPDGSARHIRAVALTEFESDRRAAGGVVGLYDITAERQALQALSESEARLEEAQSIARFGCWEWDYLHQRAKFSPEALRILDMPMDWQPHLREVIKIIPDDQRDWVVGLHNDAYAQKLSTLRYEVKHRRANGETRDVHSVIKIEYAPNGSLRRLMSTIQDVTELKTYRRQLHSLSFFDPLTQLPNRALFVDRLRQSLNDAAWHDQQLGILMLDVDRFKDINESLGHAAGDELLKQTAGRLHQVLRGYDTVARLGGDEFAVVLPEVRQPTDLGSIAHKVLNAFSAPFTIGDKEVFVTTSVGGALYPADAKDVDQLLQYADAALYHAKARGRNNFQFYSKELTAQASERLNLESELRKGIERDELELHYQPKFELSTGKLVGAEALMRWNHPTRGMVPPLSFISLAEDTGLIVPMGRWALRSACKAAVHWNHVCGHPLKIAVNLSARQFAGDTNFARSVQEILEETGCQPQWLELEITESLLLDNRDEVRDTLEELAVLGVTIAIDDFGTGYSALSYLTRFPVQILKIDRSFVKELPTNKSSAELVKAIVSLGRSLNMALVAEGVETKEQAAHLNGLGCEMVQGFLFGKPVTEAAFGKLVEAS